MDFTSLVTLVPQAGPAIAMIVITIVFLNYISKANELTAQAAHKATDAALITHELAEKKMETITHLIVEVVQENTRALTELKELIRQKLT